MRNKGWQRCRTLKVACIRSLAREPGPRSNNNGVARVTLGRGRLGRGFGRRSERDGGGKKTGNGSRGLDGRSENAYQNVSHK